MLVLNTKDVGQIAYVCGGPRVVKCTIIGTWWLRGDIKYTRVRLLEPDRCHLADDVVDYGSEWVV